MQLIIFIFFVERRLWARLQQLQASLFKLPPWSHNLRTRCQNKNNFWTKFDDWGISVFIFPKYVVELNEEVLPQANTSSGVLTTVTWRRSTRLTTTAKNKHRKANHWTALNASTISNAVLVTNKCKIRQLYIPAQLYQVLQLSSQSYQGTCEWMRFKSTNKHWQSWITQTHAWHLRSEDKKEIWEEERKRNLILEVRLWKLLMDDHSKGRKGNSVNWARQNRSFFSNTNRKRPSHKPPEYTGPYQIIHLPNTLNIRSLTPPKVHWNCYRVTECLPTSESIQNKTLKKNTENQYTIDALA